MKVVVFTSTRADFGLLNPLIQKLRHEGTHDLRLFVTGTHFNPEHGNTYREIEEAGLEAFYQVPLSMQESALGHLPIFAESVTAFSKAFASDDLPDVAFILGDRYEALAFAIVVNALGIPICHLHGGEVTEGALDDGYRHCITKLSHLHFTVSALCRRRVINMGESPNRVFDVGALAMDNISNTRLWSLAELERDLAIDLSAPYFLVTYHPETQDPEADRKQLPGLLGALKSYLNRGYTVVLTRSNADQGNTWIHEQMSDFQAKHSQKVHYVSSLGNIRYLSLLKSSQAMVGNSSSGIFEAPSFGVPTVNIGDRQKGRERAVSVIDVSVTSSLAMSQIETSLARAIELKKELQGRNVSLFGSGNTAAAICEVLNKQNFHRFEKKEFYEELGKI